MQHYLLQFVDKGFRIVCDSGVSLSYLLVLFSISHAHIPPCSKSHVTAHIVRFGEDHGKLPTYIMVTQSS